MRRQAGFTLVEVMAVVGIVAILAATAAPLYRTIQQRTYGREAVVMAKQILDAQVMYYLENNKFFPEGRVIEIYHNTAPTDPQIEDVKKALNVAIPVGHFLNFQIHADNSTAEAPSTSPFVAVTISSYGGFPLFMEGSKPSEFQAQVDRTGKFTYVVPDSGPR